jgi:DNA-binding SARP family transcriptional activator
LDVEAFETTTTLYRHLSGRELSATLALQLEEVVDLYTGDLLQGIYEDWCLFERERLNLLYLDTLGKLIIFHEFRGTYEQGLNYGNRILAFDNTREAVHRHLMRLHWLLGDRNAALVQYKRCVQILRETLNVPPTEVTARLYQQILHDQPATDRSNASRAGLAAADWRDEDAQALLEHACRRLHHLQATLDETGSELQHISRLMSAVQDRWEDANRPAERRSEDVA